MIRSDIIPLLEQVAASPPLRQRFKQAQAVHARKQVVFDHVTEAAQAFAAAAIVHHASMPARHFWILCETERDQERFHADLVNWIPGALIFPHVEVAAIEGAMPDPENAADRLSVLQALSDPESSAVVVFNRRSLDDHVAAPAALRNTLLAIQPRMLLDRDDLIGQLVASGYERTAQVAERGQFSVRGSVVDVYSWQQALPVRLEWLDQEIESIREFDVDEQRSIRPLDACVIMRGAPASEECPLKTYRTKADITLAIEMDEPTAAILVRDAPATVENPKHERYEGAFFSSPLGVKSNLVHSPELRETADRATRQQVAEWTRDGFLVVILYRKTSELSAVQSIIEEDTSNKEKYIFVEASLHEGFVFSSGKIAFVTTAELLLYAEGHLPPAAGGRRGRRNLLRQRSAIDFTELTEGTVVVHLEHGLARFLGLQSRRLPGNDRKTDQEEVMVLEFAGGAKLYVPLEQAFLVSRYVGLGKRGVALSQLGDTKWASAKKAAEKSIYDYASQLIKVQASRNVHPGVAFGPDTPWQKEFEDMFPYKETPDQARAIRETKADMESERPMDRLICGDVGFGKTEVAIRAAFKAATAGKQVAMLVPTTVLAQQHYDNFSDRMAKFPVVVELLSRYRSRADQDRVVRGVRDGSVDLVIGTHRLISRDVQFKNLGLLIVDEEQRFGVRHKERMKERFPDVDVVTLSATPIPRTLYLALTGARDLSTLETAPPNRFPVETLICAYDERIIRAAIERELDRQGQVFFLHNRVETIERVRSRIEHLCPRAKVDLGHGQMDEGQLEEVMHRFVSGQTNVLVATTIIESGLDIPNANTIIIDRADRFGLADLYQLRGRVGRGQHKAYAYLMLPRDMMTVGEARKRINAIKQYSALGAGFKIALRDLEIRGAGNILGVAQSGHLTAVGFDLYCQLLRQAVAKLRGEKVRPRVEVDVYLDFVASNEAEYASRAAQEAARAEEDDDGDGAGVAAREGAPFVPVWPAFLPAQYIEEPRLRIQAYRQLAGVTRAEELDDLQQTWRDRFGRLPPPAENLLAFARLKLLASGRKLQKIEVRKDKVMLTRGGDFVMAAGKFPRLTSSDPVHKIGEIVELIQNV